MFLPAYFIVPYCSVSLVRFFFGVLLLIYLFCPLGTGTLYMYISITVV